jgi:class 3 adenylate cyclase
MLDIAKRILTLRSYVSDDIAAVMEHFIREAPDSRLNRVNPLAFARDHGLDERECIAAFLHATQLGLFELSWNVVCASCGGVLLAAGSLQSIDQSRYSCAFCDLDYEPNLDDIVEITFTIDQRVRRIAAHDPETLPLWDYARQIFWSSGSDLPDDLGAIAKDAVLDAVELEPGGHTVRSIRMSEGLAILFDPVSHSSQFLEVAGAPTGVPQELAISLDDTPSKPETVKLAPGLLTLSLENKASRRVMPILWTAGDTLMSIISRRIPVLTAKRLLTHQTFRDLYRTNVLDVNQRFKITNLTFLFTDLKGSTELYEHIGDLAAYDLIRSHFQVMHEIVSRQGGAVVKTIGDAIMATFPTPAQGVAAAFEIRKAISELNARDASRALFLKIGLHTGPCLAVLMNERQDYFGQTVNIASRVQGIASPDQIFATSPVVDDVEVRDVISERGLALHGSKAALRGISEEMLIYGITN